MGKNVTVSANGLSVVHKGSKGKVVSTIPDICCIPGPNGKIPIPFNSKGKSKDLQVGTVSVQMHSQSVAVMGSYLSKCKGDKKGKLGGIISGNTQGKCFFFSFSPNVRMEMRPVVRKTDRSFMNDFNTVCMGGVDQKDVKKIKKKKSTIEIELLDEFDNPIAEEDFVVKFSDGKEKSGKTDAEGLAKIENAPEGSYQVRFPNRELDACKKKIFM